MDGVVIDVRRGEGTVVVVVNRSMETVLQC